MSSPPAGGRDGGTAGPEPNWYPDPSIPGYIRYWDGSAWMPGTSRPEPGEGEHAPTPPHGLPAVGGAAPADAGSATAAESGEGSPRQQSEPPGEDGSPSPTASPGGTEQPPAVTNVPSAEESSAERPSATDEAGPAPSGAETDPPVADPPVADPPVADPPVADPPVAAGAEAGPPERDEAAGEPRPDDRSVPRQAVSPPVLPELRSRDTADAPSWTPDEDVSSSPATAHRGPPAPAGQLDPRTPFRREDRPAPAAERQSPMPDDTIGIRRLPDGAAAHQASPQPASPRQEESWTEPARGIAGRDGGGLSAPADGTAERGGALPAQNQSATPEPPAASVPPQADGTAPPARPPARR